MSEYRKGKPYREQLRARPTQHAAPEVPAEHGKYPIGPELPSRHGGPATHHKETVGHLPGGGYAHPTHPNSDAMRSGNRSDVRTHQTRTHDDFNTVKMKPRT